LDHLGLATESHLRKEVLAVKQSEYQTNRNKKALEEAESEVFASSEIAHLSLLRVFHRRSVAADLGVQF
jgi:hypothetical protein